MDPQSSPMSDENVTDTSAPAGAPADLQHPAEAPAADLAGGEGGDALEDDGPSPAEQLGISRMSLQELKDKSPTDLLAFAEQLEIENANTLRKQDMLFAILKELADGGVEISGSGTMEVLQDGFGFLRSPEANYLPGP